MGRKFYKKSFPFAIEKSCWRFRSWRSMNHAILYKTKLYFSSFFSCLGFLSLNIHKSQENSGRNWPILSSLYHFHRFHQEYLDENFVVGAVLTDLSKAFDCIAHDLLIAKLAAYGFSGTALRYVYSYLSNRKQCVRINDTYSNYQKIISGVPQGSILRPIFLTYQ